MQYLAQVSQPRGRHFYQKCPISNPGGTILTKNVLASVGVTPRSKQLGVTPRTPLFEGKNPENQKLKISIK